MSIAANPIASGIKLPRGANFISGQFVESPNAPRIAVLDPATGAEIGDIPCSGADDVDAAVKSARNAFNNPEWRSLPPIARESIIHKLAELVETNSEQLAQIESLDVGKPIAFSSTLDIPASAAWLRYFAGWPSKLADEVITPAMQPAGSIHAYTIREPVGVVGAIVPWNFPLVLAIWKVAPALAAGCTVVIKPAENTPYTAIRLAELVAEAGFPEGVVNVVLGDGSTGQALVDHPDVNKISFTGSTAVGKKIIQSVAHDMKRVTLELGGKSPTIILPDANMDLAIPGAAQAVFMNTGQICFAGTRLLVPRQNMDQILDSVAEVGSTFTMGHSLSPETVMGPVISEKQMTNILGLVDASQQAGAALHSGGSRNGDSGYFIDPTILVTEDIQNPAFREEFFGPVLTATPYDDLDEIAALANDSIYGLGANIYTESLSKAHLLAAKIQAGTVWINTQLTVDPALPFGGYKQSGWGREHGSDVFSHYTETKSVIASLVPPEAPE